MSRPTINNTAKAPHCGGCLACVALAGGVDFRPAPRWPRYFVTRDGRIFSHQTERGWRPRWLSAAVLTDGYRAYGFFSGGVGVTTRLHRVTCEAFHGPPPTPAHEVRHMDGDRANCAADNLAWGTRTENMADLVRHYGEGAAHLRPLPVGMQTSNARLRDEDVLTIRRRAAAGEPDHIIARDFGVHATTVLHARRGTSWGHIGGPLTSTRRRSAS